MPPRTLSAPSHTALVAALADLEALVKVNRAAAASLPPGAEVVLEMASASWHVGQLFSSWAERDGDDANHALDDVVASLEANSKWAHNADAKYGAPRKMPHPVPWPLPPPLHPTPDRPHAPDSPSPLPSPPPPPPPSLISSSASMPSPPPPSVQAISPSAAFAHPPPSTPIELANTPTQPVRYASSSTSLVGALFRRHHRAIILAGGGVVVAIAITLMSALAYLKMRKGGVRVEDSRQTRSRIKYARPKKARRTTCTATAGTSGCISRTS